MSVHLTDWRAARNGADTAPARVLVIGDSISEGYYATNRQTQGYVAVLTAALQALYGGTGAPGLPRWSEGIYTIGGEWYVSTGHPVPFGEVYAATGPGDTLTFTATGDTLALGYVDAPTAGEFTVEIDGGAPVAIPVTAPATAVAKLAAIPLGGPGAHTVVVRSPAEATKTARIWYWEASTGTTGIRVANFGYSGKRVGHVTPAGTAWLDVLAPDLTVIAMTVNDYSGQTAIETYTASLTALATAARAHGSVLLMAGNRHSGAYAVPQADYHAAMQQVAADVGCAFLDISARWGTWSAANAAGFMYDHVHPSTAGHADYAAALEEVLGPAGDPVETIVHDVEVKAAGADDATAVLIAEGVAAVGGVVEAPWDTTALLAGDYAWRAVGRTVDSEGATVATSPPMPWQTQSVVSLLVYDFQYKPEGAEDAEAVAIGTSAVNDPTVAWDTDALTPGTYEWRAQARKLDAASATLLTSPWSAWQAQEVGEAAGPITLTAAAGGADAGVADAPITVGPAPQTLGAQPAVATAGATDAALTTGAPAPITLTAQPAAAQAGAADAVARDPAAEPHRYHARRTSGLSYQSRRTGALTYV